MLALEAATIQLETLDFGEWFLFEILAKIGDLSWLEKWQLKIIREKRQDIYQKTFVK